MRPEVARDVLLATHGGLSLELCAVLYHISPMALYRLWCVPWVNRLVPYQRRAKHAGQCGVEVEGGKVPTRDWLLNLQILTSGGFR